MYCEDCEIAELTPEKSEHENGMGTKGVQPYSVDESHAKRLWDLSKEMTGITFNVI